MKYLLVLLFLTGCATVNNSPAFISVDQMNCIPVKKAYSKRQLSELTEEEKWIVNTDSVECGVTFRNVRMRKDRVIAYSGHYSVEFWRTDEKYADDPGAPVHMTKVNIENCEIGMGPVTGTYKQVKWQVISGTCAEFDKKMQGK